jgi:diaminopimelate epimerase
VRFVKGHGTENDFVLLPDVENRLVLDASLAQRLCNRRTGIGADGVLRIAPPNDETADWFMDYRNADGSVAEMCGNGIRVFARYLIEAGLAMPGRIAVETRGGRRSVDAPAEGDVTVDMGPAERITDAKVTVGGAAYDAIGWSLGNPHLVTVVDGGTLDGLDLSVPPGVDPANAFPAGVNVEFAVRAGRRRIRMRVHERGSGETRSCGTGACAAAVAVMDERAERTCYDVDVPGGRLQVDWGRDGTVRLTGPAVLVAEGDVEESSLGGQPAAAAG